MAGLPGIRISILGVKRVVTTNRTVDNLDPEWFALMMEAKKLGISLETIRDFLKHPQLKETAIKN